MTKVLLILCFKLNNQLIRPLNKINYAKLNHPIKESKMLTVKEFKDLGVKFVEGDYFIKTTSGMVEAFKRIAPKGLSFSGELETCSGVYSDNQVNKLTPLSFAWRPLNTLPDNPKFKFEQDFSAPEIMWRPLLDQPKKSAYDVDAHVGGEKVKPVFTQEMADAGEFPPVGSLFLNEGVEVECIAIHNERVITVSDSVYYSLPRGKCHPIKILTPKQKAVSEALKLFADGEHVENAVSKLYDLWCK